MPSFTLWLTLQPLTLSHAWQNQLLGKLALGWRLRILPGPLAGHSAPVPVGALVTLASVNEAGVTLTFTASDLVALPSAQGARVGKDVFIDSLDVSDLDMVNIGDGAVINEGATITGHYFKDGLLQFGAVQTHALFTPRLTLSLLLTLESMSVSIISLCFEHGICCLAWCRHNLDCCSGVHAP